MSRVGGIVRGAILLALLPFQPAPAESTALVTQVFYGRGEIRYLPDLAKVAFFVSGQGSSAADAEAALKASVSRVADALGLAGMPSPQSEQEPGAGKATRLPGDGAPRYGAAALEFVPVRDFTLLEKVTTILTAHGVLDWFVYYPISDFDALESRAGAAATEDAARQARDYAAAHGFGEVQPASPPSVYICSYSEVPPSRGQPNPDCHKKAEPGDEGGTEEIVVTARRREGPRTDFSIPKPVERKMTATVAAAFTFK